MTRVSIDVPHRPIVKVVASCRALPDPSQGDALSGPAGPAARDKLVDNLMDHRGRQMIELQMMRCQAGLCKVRRKDLLIIHRIRLLSLLNKAIGFTSVSRTPALGGHHQHHVAEVRFYGRYYRSASVIHHLQQLGLNTSDALFRSHQAAIPRADEVLNTQADAAISAPTERLTQV